MSVYSGFATRLLETKYNRLVYSVISIMSSKLYELKEQLNKDKSWLKLLTKAYRKLQKLEQIKYLDPKFSTSFAGMLELNKPIIECNTMIKPTDYAPVASNTDTLKPLDVEISSRYSSENNKINHNMLDRICSKERVRNLSNLRLNPLETVSQKIVKSKILKQKRKLTPNRDRKKMLYYLNTSLLHV